MFLEQVVSRPMHVARACAQQARSYSRLVRSISVSRVDDKDKGDLGFPFTLRSRRGTLFPDYYRLRVSR